MDWLFIWAKFSSSWIFFLEIIGHSTKFSHIKFAVHNSILNVGYQNLVQENCLPFLCPEIRRPYMDHHREHWSSKSTPQTPEKWLFDTDVKCVPVHLRQKMCVSNFNAKWLAKNQNSFPEWGKSLFPKVSSHLIPIFYKWCVFSMYKYLFQLTIFSPFQSVIGNTLISTLQTSIIDKSVT